jgi:hypothetical protein
VADPLSELVAGLSPEDAILIMRSGCNRGPERLFITESWFQPRMERLLATLSHPITDEEASVLRDAVDKRCSLELVIEWLEERYRLPDPRWSSYVELKSRRETPRDIEGFERGYFPWEDVDACRGRLPPPSILPSQNRRGLAQVVRRLRRHGRRCPKCQRPPAEMTWIYFRSPSWTWWRMCGCEGWLGVCDHCRLQLQFRLLVMN